jgi:hypothetical protein
MQMLDHLVLKMKKGRIVEWNPYVTSESRCSVEAKQK